jgi:hypothetical protein
MTDVAARPRCARSGPARGGRLARWLLIVTAALSGTVGVTGMVEWTASRAPGDVGSLAPGSVPAAASGATMPPTAVGRAAPAGSVPSATLRPGAADPRNADLRRPARLAVPAQGIDASVVPEFADSATRALSLPRDPAIVGWWGAGAAPGDTSGTVVLAGHVDYNGKPGALLPLDRAALGTVVTVTSVDGSPHGYRVVARVHVAKASLSDAGLFRTDGSPQLALVTCGGPFDRARHSYRDNLIVLALPV